MAPSTRPNATHDRNLRLGWALLLMLVAIGAAACSTDRTTDTPRRGDPSAATSPPAPLTTMTGRQRHSAETEALDAYRQFWRIAAEVGRYPTGEWRARLRPVAAEPFLSELLKGLAEQQERGVVDFGTVQLHPTVAALLSTRASIIDCQDASRSGEADRITGEVKTVGSSRTLFTATLTKSLRGEWQITQARYLPDSC